MLSCKRLAIGEKTTKDYPYQLLRKWIVVPLNTAKESILPSPYKVLTSASSGWYNRWLVRDTCEEVVPRLQDPLGVLI